ncbi:hypothetical protein SAMN05216452_1806 [Nitratireductor aquibiodomus]|uniref:Uncharacterized protein n=1 Tax=Nitratireductor aquibiodomus TaxID=204799 RepID=A0A1H4JZP7_9HYPH|nr:hypothetical protein SAMN05216452_1806 [Nitratireductor aquibiodomus]
MVEMDSTAMAPAPHPPVGTFSPLAGRSTRAAMLTPPSPRLRGEGKGEGRTLTPTLEICE